jgi:hypothetical protein
MFEWAREVVHSFLGSREASSKNGKTPGEHSHNGHNGQHPTSDHTDAFDRFLEDYKAHIDEEFQEIKEVRQPRPRTCGPPDSPSVPTRK